MTETEASTDAYVGYGDPTGATGTLNPPDATITTDTPGSGASRLRVAVADDSSTYRVRVTTNVEQDDIAPNGVGSLTVATVAMTTAELTFVEPGDDADVGTVSGYDVRYVLGDTLDEASFDTATRATPVTPLGAGQHQRIELTELDPVTEYTVGVRAYDNCKHVGPLAVVHLQTESAEVGCGCHAGDPAGALVGIGLLALRVRRRRSR
jgi:MYXO-CTERM domain-containing protein